MADPTELYEIWAWYVLGVFIILTRYAVRIRTVGFKGLQGDDYMTIGTLLFYTLDAVTVTIVWHTGQNVDVTEAMIPDLTKSDIARLTYGSKLELTAWYSYTALIWCMKFTMLFFYKRLTLGSLHNKLVKYLFWICGVAYIGVFLTISLGCYPIQMNWQVIPIPPWKCTFRPQLFIVVAVLNIVTDAALLSIPIPMLWRLKIPLRKKIVISLILSSGLFVIAAAIIRAVYSLDSEPSASNINRWGVRETIIGIVAINIPIVRPLFTRAFWRWGPYEPQSNATRGSTRSWKAKRLADSGYTGSTGQDSRLTGTTGTLGRDIELGNTSSKDSPREQTHSRSSSQANIVDWDKKDNVVLVQTTYDISSQKRGEGSSMIGDEHGWDTNGISH